VFDAPEGKHSVEIGVQKTPIYPAGYFISGFALLALFGIVTYQKRTGVVSRDG
jgi:hypothetical protein